MQPTQCGTWQGVQLVAWKSYDPDDRLVAERCHCDLIPSILPAELLLSSGNTGARSAILEFVDAATREPIECVYAGDGVKLHPGDVPTAGTRYVFASCNNGFQPGALFLSSYFKLRNDGEPQAGRTEVRVSFGRPAQDGLTEEFITRDESIAGAKLTAPLGVLQDFEFIEPVANPASRELQLFPDHDGVVASVGPGVDFSPQLAMSYAFDVSQTCVSVTVPVSSERLTAIGAQMTDVELYRVANEEEFLAGAAPVLIYLGPPREIDYARGLVTGCTDHLSVIIGGVNLLNLSQSSYSPFERTAFPGTAFQYVPRYPFSQFMTGDQQPCADEDLIFPYSTLAVTTLRVPGNAGWIDTGINISDTPNERYPVGVSGTVDLGGPYFAGIGPWGDDTSGIGSSPRSRHRLSSRARRRPTRLSRAQRWEPWLAESV